MEYRIHLVYERYKDGAMPWQWDWENYSDDNKDMIGFFYPEDINTIQQLKQFENERQSKQK